MNRLVHNSQWGSKVWIVALSLALLPWLGSIYFCSRAGDEKPTADPAISTRSAECETVPPHLLPSGDSVRCLFTANEEPQSAKTESAWIPPSGIAAGKNIDNLDADPSPPAWMPDKMPNYENQSEPLPAPETLPIQTSGDGSAITPPNQPVDLPTGSTSKSELSAEPQTSQILTNSDSMAKSDPADQSVTVDNQSEVSATDQEFFYPSTEPLLAKRTAEKNLPVRSEQLESIARQADQQTRHGFELAGRGAYFAARSEFIAALRLVAQGLDTDKQTKIHGKSLAAGLTALKEAEDFIPSGSKLEADLDLPGIIASHTTPILKDVDKTSITTLTALKSYCTFAQEQLAQAAGNEAAGSMALDALGKLHEELAKGKGPSIKAAGPKAIAFYQASLLAYPQNFMAANDLGVMLARNGNYEDARKMFEHSLSLRRQSTVWHNLAMVYERLGYSARAQQAQQQSLIALQTEQSRLRQSPVSPGDQVRWVDESTFVRNYNPSGVPQDVPPSQVAVGGQTPPQTGTVSPPAPGIFKMLSSQFQWTNANAGQTQSTADRPLPAMRPASTGSLPNTSYDTRR